MTRKVRIQCGSLCYEKAVSKFLLSLACFGLISQTQAHGHIFTIRNTHDTTGEGSLRGAIIAANSRGGNNTILLPKGTYRLTIPGPDEAAARSGDLDITRGRLAIVGVSASKVIIDAGGLGDRVFHVWPGAQLALDDITISGGTASGGQSGGGIFNAGHLWLYRCVVRSNYTTMGVGGFVGGTGGHGAGIYNTGWLMLDLCTVLENATAGGGAGDFGPNDLSPTNRGPGGVGGSGAGICNVGTLTVNRCTISRNSTGAGGMGGASAGFGNWGNVGGKAGDGGGLYNAGTVIVNSSTLDGNLTGIGGWGGGGYTIQINDDWFICTGGGKGGNGGDGAGIYNTRDLILDTCTISGNTNGNGGGAACDGLGGDGGNGAIYSGGWLRVTSCTVSANRGGDGGLGYSFFGDFTQGRGGDAGVVNATKGAYASVRNSLIALNTAGVGFGIINCDPLTGCWPPSPVPDTTGSFTSLGYNLIGWGGGSTGLTNGVNGDLVGTGTTPLNPLLGSLQDNGGPTLTHALLPGSPAIDQGKSFGQSTDQRGRHRPHDFPSIPNAPGGDGSDIGPFELDRSSSNTRTMAGRDDSLATPGDK